MTYLEEYKRRRDEAFTEDELPNFPRICVQGIFKKVFNIDIGNSEYCELGKMNCRLCWNREYSPLSVPQNQNVMYCNSLI